jgi:hypothetical protein
MCLLGEVYFWPSNYHLSLVLVIELENQKSFIIHLAIQFVLMGGLKISKFKM